VSHRHFGYHFAPGGLASTHSVSFSITAAHFDRPWRDLTHQATSDLGHNVRDLLRHVRPGLHGQAGTRSGMIRGVMGLSGTLPAVLIIVGGLAVAGLIAYVMVRQEKRRLEDFVAWAATIGYTIVAGSKTLRDAGLSSALITLPVFNRGTYPRVRYVVRGQGAEGELVLFDFRYTTQSGKNTTTIEQTIVAFGLGQKRVPDFELWPEGFLSKLGQAFGMADINFDSNPEFSRHYRLRGPDRESVRRLFAPQAAGCLAESTGWSIQGAHSWVIFFHDGRRQKVQELTTFIESAHRILGSLLAAR
jgi:hypothetical protein